MYEARVLERHVFGQSFELTGPAGTRRELRTPMLGRHQIDNAATAVAAAEAMRERGHAISERAIVDGIAYSRLHGRMEVMGQRPLMVADGAHNGDSAAALAATLKDYFEWRRCFVILGCMGDKDVEAIARPLTDTEITADTPYSEEYRTDLKCPFCQADLKNKDDYLLCPNGDGILIKGAAMVRMHAGSLKIDQSLLTSKQQTQTAVMCPSCGNPMGKIPYNGGQTMIDSCSNCPYRWLDASDITAVAQKPTIL